MAVTTSRILAAGFLPAALLATPVLGQTPQGPATPLEPVTTIGTKTERTRDEIPNAVTIVGPEEIERRNPSKVDDLINDIPGVEMIGGPRRAGQDLSIRGFEGTRVVTIIDGARSNFDAGHKGRIFNDPDLLKQVEVLKGPASALRGTGAVGGVVSLTTKDAADFLEPGESYAFRGKYGYSSAARENLYSATHAGRPASYFDYLANYTYRPGGTIRTGGGGELVNSAEDLRTGLFKVGINPAENHRIGLSHQLVRDYANVPLAVDSSTTSTNYATRHLVENHTSTLSYGYRNPEGGWLNPNMTVYENKFHVSDQYNPTSTTTRTDVTDLLTTGFDIYNTSRFDGFGSHAVTYGVEYFRDDQVGYRNGSLRDAYPRSNRDVYGYYIQDEITFGAISLIPGVRYDQYEQVNDTTAARPESKASPKLGAIWRALPWMSVVGSYAQGFRAPSLTELYIGGTAGPHTFVANPDLKPEKTETYEGGLRFKFDNVAAARDTLRLSGTVFYTRAEDFIDAVTSGTTITYRNITRASIDGAEAEAMYDMPRVFAGLGVSRVRGHNDATGQHVSSMPADKLTVTGGGKVPEYDMVYGLRSRFYARQSRIDSTSTTLETGGYAVHGIFASWLPSHERLSGLRLDVGIDNLFDKLYRRHGTALYEEGRDYHGAVSYTVKF
jgi:hemoglobin/transferrin/lactoferrin receptor protein